MSTSLPNERIIGNVNPHAYIGSEQIGEALTEGNPRTVVVQIQRGQTAWNPASTKEERRIRGPERIRYAHFEDGAWEATILNTKFGTGFEEDDWWEARMPADD